VKMFYWSIFTILYIKFSFDNYRWNF